MSAGRMADCTQKLYTGDYKRRCGIVTNRI